VAPFVTTLIALGLPAGVGVLVCIVMLRQGMSIYHNGDRLADHFMLLSLIGFQFSIIPLLFAVLLRRRFFRLRPHFQWLIAICGLLEAAVIFGFFLIGTMIR